MCGSKTPICWRALAAVAACCCALLSPGVGQGVSLTALLKRERAAAAALDRLAHRVARQEATVADLRHREQQARYALAEAERRQAALVKRLAARRAPLIRRMRALYKLSRGTLVRLLLDADRGQQSRRAARALQLIIDRDLHEVRTYHEEALKLQRRKSALRQQQQQQRALARRLAAEQQALRRAEREQREILAVLRRGRSRRVRLAEELTARQQQLLQQIAAFSSRTRAPAGFSLARGRLPRPAEGFIAVRFGEGKDPQSGLRVARSGVTIRTAPRASVRAVAAGTVRLAGQVSGFGGAVLVDHGEGYYTLSAYLDEVRAVEGNEVSVGTVIGRAGADPLSGDPAVHFEIRHHQRAIDPAPWFKIP